MTIQDLGSIGEFVGAIAVVFSLIYLALQIRQNTRSLRAATHHSSARAVLDVQNVFAEDRELAQIFLRGAREFEQLTPEERLRFDALMRSVFVYYEDTFFQYRQSLIDPQLWNARQTSLLDHLGLPGVVSWWRRASRHFAEPFVAHIEHLLQQLGFAAEQGNEADRP